MSGDDHIRLHLTVRELEAIERSLRAANALDVPTGQRPVIEDTLQLVESALSGTMRPRAA